MKKIILIIIASISVNLMAQEKSTYTSVESNKYIISEEGERNNFEETVEDASKKIKELAKRLKGGYQKYLWNENPQNKKMTFEQELSSNEFNEAKKKLGELCAQKNPKGVREHLEFIAKKFPEIAKHDSLGFKHHFALSYFWEGNYKEAKKLAAEVINVLKKYYSNHFNPNNISANDKKFIAEVFELRGVIDLYFEKHYHEASDDLEISILLNPEHMPVKKYLELTRACTMSSRTKKAAQAYAMLYKVLPNANVHPNEHKNICIPISYYGYDCPPCKNIVVKELR